MTEPLIKNLNYMQNDSNNISLLWDKVCDYGKKAGRVAARPVLLLYYVMTDPNTQRSDKVAIGAALAYLVLPVNLVSMKRHPLFGWVDEAASIAVIAEKMKHLVTIEMESRAADQLDKWFGPEIQDATEVK